MRVAGTHLLLPRLRLRCGALSAIAAMAIALGLLADVSPASAQRRALVTFPPRPKPAAQRSTGILDPSLRNGKEQMLVPIPQGANFPLKAEVASGDHSAH